MASFCQPWRSLATWALMLGMCIEVRALPLNAERQGPQSDEEIVGPAAWRAWREETDGAKRRAIVFTPPFGGVRLEALKQDREVVHTWDLICDRNTFGKWEPEWLPPSGWMSLVKTHCLIENLAIPPPKGVSVRYRDDYDSCMYLSNTSRTVHDIVWGRWSELMEQHGWERDKTLFAFAMDWRQGPPSYSAAPDQPFLRFKQLIEKAVRASGGPVTLVSMSLGGPFVALFCADYVSEAWKADHIHSFVSVSGVYGGSSSPLNTLFSGKWGELIPSYLLSTSRDTARTTEVLPWLIPAASVFGEERPWLRTPTRNFTASDLASPLRESGAHAAADLWSEVTHLTGNRLAPNVSTVCIYGTGSDTVESLIWADDDLTRAPDAVSTATGDGTVLHESLAACSRWQEVQSLPVKTVTLPGVQHTEFLTNGPAMRLFLKVMLQQGGGWQGTGMTRDQPGAPD